ADERARASAVGAVPLFWVGLLLAYLPMAVRAVAPGAWRRERIALLAALAVLLSLVKVLEQPAGLSFFDEFGHWRSLIDLQQSHSLFTTNPLMGISPSYPGLESAAAALMGATGLPVVAVAPIVIGAARLVLVLSLFLFFEQATGSTRVGAAAALVYISNPRFVFFDDQFAYESLALGLAAFILYLHLRRSRGDAPPLGSWSLIALAVLALVVTHHLTTYALLGFLGLWVVVAELLRRLPRRPARGWGQALRLERPSRPDRELAAEPVALAVLILAAVVMWLATVGWGTFGYLQGAIGPSIQEVAALLLQHGPSRQLFRATNGQVQPLWQRGLGLGSAVFVVGLLPLGIAQVWRRWRRQPLAWALVLVALGYPASLGLHFTADGAEIADRMSELVFLGVGAVLALTIDLVWPVGLLDRGRAGLRRAGTAAVGVTSWLAVVFSGGVIVGWAPQLSLPGPYLVGADNRSVDAISVAAALWTRQQLGPGNRFAADRSNRNLLGTYGQQYPVDEDSDIPTAQIFLSPTFDPYDLSLLRRGRVRYLLVDRRLGTAQPLTGTYYESGDTSLLPAGHRVPAAWLNKFDSVHGASRIYDNGDIRIYDLGALLDG
ncbi:MAG: hypothetical protein J2P45_22650, partial [Candidatus Dormibacteraeota bacterium]|nr:hypothetical protein [Candidatus Dormibacteraeota bacterium]